MADPKLTHTATMILYAIDAGYEYGLSVMEATGLPSGTVYPALRRLEASKLVRSAWESQKVADAGQRPVRKYYKLTASGRSVVESARKRFPLLAALKPATAGEW